MKEKSSTNLSEFLHIIHQCMKDDVKMSGQDIVRYLLEIQEIYYGDEKQKSIYTGYRPINPVDIENLTKKDRLSQFKSFFKSILDPTKIRVLMKNFDIEDDEKEDFNSLIEAISSQYQNFTRYGDKTNSTVNSIYCSILDSKLKAGVENANIDAVVAATQLFYSSVTAMADIKLVRSLAEIRTPLETFLRNTFDVFNAFLIRCNHVGRMEYKSARDEFFKKNKDISYYLKMASEPGSLPLDLENTVTIVMYGCGKNGDLVLDGRFDYDLEYTPDALIACFKQTVPDDAPIIDFSEYLNIHVKGDDRSLINDFRNLVNDIFSLLKTMQEKFGAKEKCEKINEDIVKTLQSINGVQLSLVSDGHYIPKDHKVIFAPTMDMYYVEKNGRIIRTGDDKLSFETMKNVYSDSFVDFLTRFASHLLVIMLIRDVHPNKYANVYENGEVSVEIMTEMILLDKDKKTRYYMFPPTCNAKQIRRVKEISERIKEDKTLAFAFGQVYEANITLAKEMSVTEHDEFLVIIGYWNKKVYQIAIPTKYIKESYIKTKTNEEKINPEIWKWIKHIKIVDEGYLPLLKPMYEEIHKVEDEGYQLNYMKD